MEQNVPLRPGDVRHSGNALLTNSASTSENRPKNCAVPTLPLDRLRRVRHRGRDRLMLVFSLPDRFESSARVCRQRTALAGSRICRSSRTSTRSSTTPVAAGRSASQDRRADGALPPTVVQPCRSRQRFLQLAETTVEGAAPARIPRMTPPAVFTAFPYNPTAHAACAWSKPR
jgi:hypothetical protein